MVVYNCNLGLDSNKIESRSEIDSFFDEIFYRTQGGVTRRTGLTSIDKAWVGVFQIIYNNNSTVTNFVGSKKVM